VRIDEELMEIWSNEVCDKWREVDGIMYKEGKVYMPKDKKLRVEIIRLHHDMLIEGYGGQ